MKKDEAIDYNWLIDFKKNYPAKKENSITDSSVSGVIPLTIAETGNPPPSCWQVSQLVLCSPTGDTIEIKSTNMMVIAELLRQMA